MEELLKKVFTDVISQQEDCIRADKYMDTQIKEMIHSYEEKLTIEEMEILSGLLYHVALISKQDGFLLGMKYLSKIAVYLLTNL